jgi:phytanoyl-CoA hydroxylase
VQLSAKQRKSFSEDGFLVIPGFFSEAELDTATDAYDSVWRDLPPDVVVDTGVTNRRVRIKELTDEERTQSFKINDLYLRDEPLRQSLLSARLGAILTELMDDEPVIINTLSVEFGTQQPDHLDTLYMTPHSAGSLVASWMAIEDADLDAGPLRYYPESNHIEPFRFRNGGFHVYEPEMERWADYMAAAVERRGLEECQFAAKRGDLFLWNAWLLHGGSEIHTPGLTRKSLITHYFTKSDCDTLQSSLERTPGGWWMNRAPQSVPEPINPTRDAPAQSPADAVFVNVPPDGAPAPSSTTEVTKTRDLRDRLSELDAQHH